MVITNKRREQLRNASKRWRKNHPERVRARQKKWDKNHPEYKRNYTKKWRKENPEKYKNQPSMSLEKRRIVARNFRKNLRIKIIQLLGGRCSNPNCLVPNGCSDWRCLQIDHVNGGGCKEIKSFKTYWGYCHYVLTQIKSGSKDYQLLCANCNWIKRYENEEGRIDEQKVLKNQNC